MRLKPIDQQVVVVVGCTSGIGLETVKEFARRGATLVLAGRGQDDLNATLDAVQAEGAEAITVEADVADYGQVQNIAQQAVDTYGRIDTWAHVAGTPLYSKVEDTDPADFRRVLDVNLNGPMNGILAALPHLKREGRGALIIVSSVDARVPLPYQGPYVASKQGLQGLVDTLRIELKHDGYPISVTNIKPATISTPFFEKAKTNLGFEPGLMPPIYSAKSVADAIVYAAEHPVRTLNVGSTSSVFQASRITPRLSDATIQAVAFKGQQTDIVKGADAPNNLYQHIEGYHRVEGKEPGMYSKSTWLQTHPAAKWVLRGLLLAALPIGVALYVRSRRQRKLSLPQRAGQTISDAISSLASAGVVASLISRFRPRQKALTQRLRRTKRATVPVLKDRYERVREALPDARHTIEHLRERLPNLPRRQQTMPEKLMSKVQDIMPKSWFPAQRSLPERALDRIKDVQSKSLFRRGESIPDRLAKKARDVSEDIREREFLRRS